MTKYQDINEEGLSIRCKLYCDDPRGIRRVIVFGHGFGGHMDNHAAERFADKALAKYKHLGILTFNWPCHGNDARGRLSLSDCDTYLRLVLSYARGTLGAQELYAYATSFGAYLFLKYISEHGMPFRKAVFRCPAVPMYEIFTHSIIGEEELEKLSKGKPVLAGFDRKVRITQEFLDEIREADVTERDFLELSDDILLQHGTRDEIVPIERVRAFADDNLLELQEIEGADHRFQDPKKMDLAISGILKFMKL